MPVGRELIRCVIVRSTAAEYPVYAFSMASGLGFVDQFGSPDNTVDDVMAGESSRHGLRFKMPSIAYMGEVSRSAHQVAVPGVILMNRSIAESVVVFFPSIPATFHCVMRRFYDRLYSTSRVVLVPDNPTVRASSVTSGEVRVTVTNSEIYQAADDWPSIYRESEERAVWGSVQDAPAGIFSDESRAHQVTFTVPYRPPGLNAWMNLVSYIDFGGVRMEVLRSDVDSGGRQMRITAQYEVI